MSAKPSGPNLIHLPNLFSTIEPGVYRCASPTAHQVTSSTRYSSLHSADPVAQVRFLATLNLRTIISLTPEHPIKPFLTFTRAAGIHFVRHPPESPLQQVLTRAAALRGDILAPVDGLATDPGRSGQGDPRMSTGRP